MGRPNDGTTRGEPDCVPTRAALFWGLVAAGVVLDQATKLAIVAWVGLHELVPVIPRFFYLTHTLNPGIVFGIGSRFGPAGKVLLSALNVVIIGVVIYVRTKAKVPALRRPFDLALGLILAGAFGNLIDRVHPPWRVVDFLDFWLGTPARGTWHYPTFNVADIFIVVGVGVYIYWTLVVEKKVKAAEARSGGST